MIDKLTNIFALKLIMVMDTKEKHHIKMFDSDYLGLKESIEYAVICGQEDVLKWAIEEINKLKNGKEL